jgi:hypothetical protein
MSWADADDVVTITGREATVESLAAAQVIVEIFSGTTEQASDDGLVATRNLRMLKNAVAFQAVWLDSHPDVLDAMDVEGVSQDGLNAQYANAHAHLLAPLANRCIERLSWKREIRVGRSRAARLRADRGNRDSAVRDDQYAWAPLPFGETP